MFLGNTLTVPNIVNLPGQAGGAPAFEYTAIDNSFSMEFDGASETYFDTSSSIGNYTGSWSISFWFKKPSAPSVREYILYGGQPSYNLWDYQFVNTTGQLLMWNINGISWLWTNTNVCDGNWHHIVYLWHPYPSPTGGNYFIMQGYVDGVLDRTNDLNDYRYAGNLYDGPLRIIGARPGQNSFSGHLDEWAIWDSTLSPETIKAIYDATANNPGKVADLSETPEGLPAAWYRMGD
jgi:hypothetical protein